MELGVNYIYDQEKCIIYFILVLSFWNWHELHSYLTSGSLTTSLDKVSVFFYIICLFNILVCLLLVCFLCVLINES
jgi:hypothetical protein